MINNNNNNNNNNDNNNNNNNNNSNWTEWNTIQGVILSITWVSNYRYSITISSNLTPVIGHPHDCAPIMWQIGVRRTNHD